MVAESTGSLKVKTAVPQGASRPFAGSNVTAGNAGAVLSTVKVALAPANALPARSVRPPPE
jgi:hypothetical protein